MTQTHAYRINSAGFTFERLCEILRAELGETLYTAVHPVQVDKDLFYINIPEQNATRISETFRYSGIWATAYPMRMTQRILAHVNK